jgi:hypothetical protein
MMESTGPAARNPSVLSVPQNETSPPKYANLDSENQVPASAEWVKAYVDRTRQMPSNITFSALLDFFPI